MDMRLRVFFSVLSFITSPNTVQFPNSDHIRGLAFCCISRPHFGCKQTGQDVFLKQAQVLTPGQMTGRDAHAR